MLKGFKKFKSELEVAEFLEAETRKNGCSLAFPPIVASGKHAGMPHYMPGKGKILKGFCVIDFGVKYRGYCSDITRTVYVGKPSQAEKEIYEEVLDVQKKSVKMCMGGGSISGVFDYALNVLGKRFPHGLGHGIGVEIHEWPNLKPGGKEKFLDGMVFTVEPGVYTKKYGIRIEDDVLIEKGKSVILTKLSKELIIV
jgi:Xaa-Pro aminopeptidase